MSNVVNHAHTININKLYTLGKTAFLKYVFGTPNSDWMKIPNTMGDGHPSSNLVRTQPAAMYKTIAKQDTLDHTFGYSS